jgi:Zn finger protein HypA/HybF involved in hydrogenase expression
MSLRKQNDYIREEGFHVMVKEVWLQCQCCGELHKKKVEYNIEDIYIQEECPRCRDETTHLICGEDEWEIYHLYNLNTDPRYYNYKTK